MHSMETKTKKICSVRLVKVLQFFFFSYTMSQLLPDEHLSNDCYNLALDLVRAAGEVVKEGFEKLTKTVNTKSGSWDLVTEYDGRVEQLLINGITGKYPDHK